MSADGWPPAGPTPSQTVGPFFRFGLEWMENTELVDPTDPAALTVTGRVTDGAGDPVPDAVVEIWQADAEGRFGEDAVPGWTGFGRGLTDASGAFRFVTVVPGPVAGVNGELQAPHIDVSVFARGLLNRLVTRLYFPGQTEAHAGDPVLSSIADPAARRTLVARPGDDGGVVFHIRLQGEEETVFFAW